MTRKIGNGNIPLRIGRLIDTTVYGGPYRQVPEFFWGVKMAEEINHPHMVAVDTRDFSVPEVSDLKKGIVKALMAMINEEDVYAGCAGGIGRTGIFLAALAKVQIEYRKSKHRAGRGEDPVLYVRKHFIPHAVETKQQEEFIANLDVSDIVEWLNVTQNAMGLGGLTPGKSEDWQDTRVGAYVQENWESQRDSRILDWVDSPEADSATEAEVDYKAAIDSLQSQLDEMEARIDAQNEAIQDLTNQTLSSRVWGIFSK
jgi:hypothetical protein